MIIGSEDYMIRTFTRDPARANKGEEYETFTAEVKSKTTNTDLE